MSYSLRHKTSTETSQQRKSEALKCLNVIESFRASEGKNKPEWMVLNVIPVIPPERPLVPLDGDVSPRVGPERPLPPRHHPQQPSETPDRNQGPEVILRNEKRMLQEAVDSLFDNSRKSNAVKNESNRPLKSLFRLAQGQAGPFPSEPAG